VAFAPEVAVSGSEAARLLWEGEPGIAVAVDGTDAISLTPELLGNGEEEVVFERVGALARVKARV
jgi:hypothetical protein